MRDLRIAGIHRAGSVRSATHRNFTVVKSPAIAATSVAAAYRLPHSDRKSPEYASERRRGDEREEVRGPVAQADQSPVLYIVACGGRPAGQLPDFVRFAQAEGWDVCVIVTPDGTKFLDAPQLAELTGHPVRVQYKHPDEPDVLPPPDALVIAPATFNTMNKLAAGISDTLALGLLNEAIGLGLPIIAVPWPSIQLSRHPAFQRSLEVLREWGIQVILDPSRLPQASPEPAVFPWDKLRIQLKKLKEKEGVRLRG